MFECLYGMDAATNQLTDSRYPGCTATRCNARWPCSRGNMSDGCGHGSAMCGFAGAPATAWSPSDLKRLLQLHRDHGPAYAPAGFHSGYNEAVINSIEFNAQLPGIVEAFFVPVGAYYNGDASGISAVRAWKAYLAHYHLTEAQVPLLRLDPSDWDAPFWHLPRAVVHTAARPGGGKYGGGGKARSKW